MWYTDPDIDYDIGTFCHVAVCRSAFCFDLLVKGTPYKSNTGHQSTAWNCNVVHSFASLGVCAHPLAVSEKKDNHRPANETDHVQTLCPVFLKSKPFMT